ncbi:MAG: DUF3237 family protein [Streptosporangiaceae bacterium]
MLASCRDLSRSYPTEPEHDRIESAVHDDRAAEGAARRRERPTGQRVIAEIASASLSGRLSGSLAGGSSADWLTMVRGGLGLPDVRIAIRTEDGAVVLMRYAGRIRFVPGQASIVMIAPVFETGDPRYSWLNEIQAVGKGILSADLTTLDYEICELQ